jgi:hypothetical protein
MRKQFKNFSRQLKKKKNKKRRLNKLLWFKLKRSFISIKSKQFLTTGHFKTYLNTIKKIFKRYDLIIDKNCSKFFRSNVASYRAKILKLGNHGFTYNF